MESAAPEGWEQDSPALFLHSSGVRIERRIYRQKDGWFLVPVDLDQAVAEFAPDPEGLALAFSAFAGGMFNPKAATARGRAELAGEAARRDEKLEHSSDEEEARQEAEEDED
jgi:hypothetical protein